MSAKKPRDQLVSLRLDKETFEDLERLSKTVKEDKTALIRDAIQDFLIAEEQQLQDYYIEDYVNARMDEKEFKQRMDIKEIANDLQQARKEIINKIKGGKK
jgi:predicted DNA-binding protein